MTVILDGFPVGNGSVRFAVNLMWICCTINPQHVEPMEYEPNAAATILSCRRRSLITCCVTPVVSYTNVEARKLAIVVGRTKLTTRVTVDRHCGAEIFPRSLEFYR